MEYLSNHIKETIDRVDGFQTGTLIVEEGKVSLLQSDNTEIKLDDTFSIEVRNDNLYEKLSIETILNTLTVEGWPGYAGLYARVKTNE
jgi:hypothetical protein